SWLQRALGKLAFGVAHVGSSGRQLEAERGAVEIEALRAGALGAPLAPAKNPRVAELAEVPRLEQVLPHMVVDMRMVAADEGQRRRHAPFVVEHVIERSEPVAVDRADLVVVLRDLADADLAAAGAWLVLVDVFE